MAETGKYVIKDWRKHEKTWEIIMFGILFEVCIGKAEENDKTKCKWKLSPKYSDPVSQIRSQKLPFLCIKRREINYCPVGWNLASETHCTVLYYTVQTYHFKYWTNSKLQVLLAKGVAAVCAAAKISNIWKPFFLENINFYEQLYTN